MIFIFIKKGNIMVEKLKRWNVTTSKRFWFSFLVFIIDILAWFLAVWLGGADPIAAGTGITMISSPLYVYVIGETTRPSGTNKGQKIE